LDVLAQRRRTPPHPGLGDYLIEAPAQPSIATVQMSPKRRQLDHHPSCLLARLIDWVRVGPLHGHLLQNLDVLCKNPTLIGSLNTPLFCMLLQTPSPTLHSWRPSKSPSKRGPHHFYFPFLYFLPFPLLLPISLRSARGRRSSPVRARPPGLTRRGAAAGALPPERGSRSSPAQKRQPVLAPPQSSQLSGARRSSSRSSRPLSAPRQRDS
jgi:hypothetical protein